MIGAAAIGVDLGGTNIKLGLVEAAGRVIAKTAAPLDSESHAEQIVEQIGGLTDELLRLAAISPEDVIGVGVGAPGPLSPRTGRIYRCANLPRWIDIPLRDLVSARLKKPVSLDNDGNCAALGEFRVGVGRGGGDLVVLTLGTGIGAGVVTDGKILHGHFENAAELGHMIVECNGIPCACGQRGCLEAYASASAVARRARSALGDKEQSSLTARVEQGGAISAEDVVAAAKNGDQLSLRLWNETCRYLAVGCINIQHAFNPQRIALGGGMARAGAFLLDGVCRYVHDLTWKLHDDVPEIVLAELGYDAGIIGAAALAWTRKQPQ